MNVWLWVAVGAAGWVVLSLIVGYLIGGATRLRDSVVNLPRVVVAPLEPDAEDEDYYVGNDVEFAPYYVRDPKTYN